MAAQIVNGVRRCSDCGAASRPINEDGDCTLCASGGRRPMESQPVQAESLISHLIPMRGYYGQRGDKGDLAATSQPGQSRLDR